MRILLLILLFATSTVSAQNQLYVSVEASGTNDYYKITDPGKGLREIPLFSGQWGINFRQEIGKHLFIETGLLRKYYTEGIGFRSISSYSTGNAINAWLIPLRFGARMNVRKDHIYLLSSLGMAAGFNSDYANGNGGQGGTLIVPGKDSIQYGYIAHYDYAKNYHLLQAGLGLEFHLFQKFLLSLSYDYYFGLNKLVQDDITYTINSNPPQTATATSKGNMFAFTFAFRYPIGNIWGIGEKK